MPRQARVAPPGYVYHVINRTAGKFIMLRKDEDFAALERVLLEVLRHVERNALSAELSGRAEQWRWGSLWVREEGPEPLRKLLAEWPGGRPEGWAEHVNQAITAKELSRLELSEERSRPYGEDAWVGRTAGKLGLAHTIRNPWRPAAGGKEPATDRGAAKK